MLRLLKANLYKLLKEKSFYIIFAISIGFKLLSFALNSSITFVDEEGNTLVAYSVYASLLQIFTFMNGVGLYAVIAVSVYMAREFSNGTIRNKIAVGHSHKSVYFSNIITALIMTLILLIGNLLITLVEVAANGFAVDVTAAEAVRQILCGLIILITGVCVVTFISMITRGNSGILFNILGTFVLSFVTLLMFMSSEGTLWEILNAISMSTFLGQSVLLTSPIYHTLTFFLYVLISGVITSAAAVAGGAYLFERLDIK